MSRVSSACSFLLSGSISSCRKIQDCSERNWGGEEPSKNVGDDLVCPMDCLFYRQYQLPCKHLWHYCITTLPFSSTDWARWAALFEDGGFEIYEATTKTYVEDEIYDTIGGPDRGSLMMREILDHVKTRYYEMSEDMAE